MSPMFKRNKKGKGRRSMIYFNRFLRKKAYRTYAVLASGAALAAVMAVSGGGHDVRSRTDVGTGGRQAALLKETEEDADDEEASSLPLDIKSLVSVRDVTISFMSRNNITVEAETAMPEKERETNDIQEEAETTTEKTTDVKGLNVTEGDYEALQRIVEAEAGNQDDIGRILVANVVINRTKSDKFPDSITENIFEQDGDVYQFAPIGNGSYYTVTVSEETKKCVDRALGGEDYSQGALFFTRKTSPDSWFNTSLTFLFVHGAHYFYR